MAEIGEPVFVENDLQDLDLNLQALPPPLQQMGDQMNPEERGRRKRGQGRAHIPENEQGPQRMRVRGRIHTRRGQRANRGRGQVPRGLAAQARAEFFAQLSEDDEEIQPQLALVQEPIPENIAEICIICMDEEVSVILIPCRHTFCLICVLRLQRDAIQFIVCLLCRGNIDSWENM